MAFDDFEDRRRESNDYWDRRSDQLDSEARRAERSQSLYDALRKKDDSTARWLLDVPPPSSSETRPTDADVSGEKERVPTADQQFAEHSGRLLAVLGSPRSLPGRGLPASITTEWVNKIKTINMYKPSLGLAVLDELFSQYFEASEKYKPRPSIWNMDVDSMMRFDDDMSEIKRELNWLRDILKHVEAYLKQSPL
jgi:hypothetical protein